MKKRHLKYLLTPLLCICLCMGAAFSMVGAACAAEEPSPVSIAIMLPASWANSSAAAKICVADTAGKGFAKVEIRMDRNGSWRDITASLEQREGRYYGAVDMTDNGAVYVRVTGCDGEIYENSRYIECFDHTPPTLRTSASGDSLHVEAADDLSGVAWISVDGARYSNLTAGALDVPLKSSDFSRQISLQAADLAGNLSETVRVENPTYPNSTGMETPVQTKKPVAGSAVSAAPAEVSSQESSSKPLTPSGQGTVVDNVTEEDGKEFFTFTTPNEHTFYLIVDKQREEENVYFLNAVTENDLLNLAEKDPEQPSESAVPDPEPVCDCTDKCVPGEVKTDCPVCALSRKDCAGKEAAIEPGPEPEKPEPGGSGTLFAALFVALAVGGAGYYLKIYKPKKALDDADDFEELTGGETVNEDAEEPSLYRGTYDEPEEPDFPEEGV